MSIVRPIKMLFADFCEQQAEGGIGYCAVCNHQHDDYVDPDGRDILCAYCGRHSVYGLDELMMMSLVEFTDEDFD